MLKFKNYLGYGLGSVAQNISFSVIGFYLLYFYTDVAGISVAAVGTMFLISRIWDAINDPIIGVIVDKSNTRWGKFRPFILLSALPLGLSTMLCFTSPDFGPTGKLIYAYVTYILFGMMFTVCNIPYSALTSVMTQDTHEREKLTFYRQAVGATLGVIIAALVARPLVDVLGKNSIATGWQQAMMLMGIFITFFLFVCYATSKEENVSEKREKINVKDSISMVLRNKPLIRLMFSFILTFAVNSVSTAVGLYYLKYYLHREDLFIILALTGIISTIIIMPFMLGMIRKFGKKRVFLFALFTGMIIHIIKFLLPPDPMLFIIVSMLGGMSFAPLGIVQYAFVPETIEYGEWKTGVRAEGFVNSIVGFAYKLGMAAGGIIPGFVFAVTGYVANVEQTPLALWGIRALTGLIPAILLLICFISFFKYELVEERCESIMQELNERNKKVSMGS